MKRSIWMALAFLAAPALAQQQPVNVGAVAGDGTGDPLRTAFIKLNANDTNLYAIVAAKAASGANTDITSITGSAAKLTTARAINGVNFDGTSPITINAVDSTARLAASANLSDLASPSAARTNLGLGTLATQSGTFSGTSSGTNTGDQTSVSGNAGTANKLATAITINGVSFDGSANVTVPAVDTATPRLAVANNLSDLASKPTARGSLQIKRPYASGRWYVADWIVSAGSATGSPGGGSMRCFVGWVRENVTIIGLSSRISGAAAGGNVQMAVYATDPASVLPTGPALYSSASIAASTAGNRDDTSPSLALTPGNYAFCSNTDATGGGATFYTLSGTQLHQILAYGGSTSSIAIGAGVGLNGIARTQTFASWPTLTGSFTGDSWTEITTTTIPVIAFKAQ